jgi:hypothetical protein
MRSVVDQVAGALRRVADRLEALGGNLRPSGPVWRRRVLQAALGSTKSDGSDLAPSDRALVDRLDHMLTALEREKGPGSADITVRELVALLDVEWPYPWPATH